MLLTAAVALALATSSRAQELERPLANATHTSTPPVIDGKLDDEVWQLAPPIGELTQVIPLQGVAPSLTSDIRVLYDEDHLYIGMRFYDDRPDDIIVTTRERDADLEADDRVEIVLDTFLDRRNAFWFQMNAGGSMGDALITNNGQDFNKPWNGIWEGRSRVDAQGWVVEMELPYKTLNFKKGLTTWGLNVQRYIGRLREQDRWSGADQNYDFFNIFVAGDLTGIEDITQGFGLDFVPFFVANLENTEEGDKNLLGDLGFDAFYNITPNLLLSLTYNTDFAETEVDDRQINLTRFPLFFPERRDFFLQDAGLFDFDRLGNDLIPFFSRRIGLADDGEVVPIIAGAKLTGRAGDYNIGVLDVLTEDTDTVEGENNFVARLSRNVGEQSTIGGIFTSGDPGSSASNILYGVDANYSTSRFQDNKNLEASVWYLGTDTEGVSGDESSYGARLAYPNDVWSWRLSFKEIQENFNAGLGFVPRDNIRRYRGSVSYEPRIDETVRQLEFGLATEVTTDTDDDLETAETELQPFGIEWESGDELRLELVHVYDKLDQDFEIFENVTIPADEYDWLRFRIEAETADNRPFALGITFATGNFFDGTRTDYFASLLWQPGPLFNGMLEYSINDVSLEGGDFTTQVSRLRANFSFTPTLAWNNFIQWDNVSDIIGVNSRLFWIIEQGQEVFLVFNQSTDIGSGGVAPINQGLTLKIAYTIRF